MLSYGRTRGSVLQLLQCRQLDTLGSVDPKAHQLQRSFVDARHMLAHHLLSPIKDAKDHRERTKELTTAKEDLEKKLILQLNLNPKRPKPLETTPDQLAKVLPGDTAFVDLLLYTDFEQDHKTPGIKGKNGTKRYVAFVMLPGKTWSASNCVRQRRSMKRGRSGRTPSSIARTTARQRRKWRL